MSPVHLLPLTPVRTPIQGEGEERSVTVIANQSTKLRIARRDNSEAHTTGESACHGAAGGGHVGRLRPESVLSASIIPPGDRGPRLRFCSCMGGPPTPTGGTG